MSYILDALKKSEKDRRQGTLPDMLSVHDIVAERPKKRLVWVYLLVTALFMNAGVLVWWLGSSNTEKTKATQTATAEETSTMPVNEAPQAGSDRVKISRETAPTVGPEKKTAAINVATLKERPASAVRDTKPVAAANVLPEVPVVQSSTETKVTASGGGMMKPAGLSNEKVTGAEAGIEEIPVENKTYKLEEIPLSVRGGLPAFSISALLYSVNPGSRMVRINEKMMREGQELAAGLRLEEIAKDGLIFSYRKYRFYVAAK